MQIVSIHFAFCILVLIKIHIVLPTCRSRRWGSLRVGRAIKSRATHAICDFVIVHVCSVLIPPVAWSFAALAQPMVPHTMGIQIKKKPLHLETMGLDNQPTKI